VGLGVWWEARLPQLVHLSMHNCICACSARPSPDPLPISLTLSRPLPPASLLPRSCCG
jgi:hypothetical protein